ncbi:MAG: hypothetical protein RL150_682 [Candidatus Parcubacteria bacterium]|jgi:SET domain-containing protein
MLKVKTTIKQSPLHGLGLFADEDIKEGTVIWEFEPGLDISITKDEYDSLSQMQKDFFDHYGYWSDELHLYICAADGWRFTNHSTNPNTATIHAAPSNEGQDIAIRDIKASEELLFDYRSFGENPEQI